VIDRLFDKFRAIYGPRFKHSDKAQWRKGLEGIKPHEIAHGLDQARKLCDWPPSIAEFRKLCRPEGQNAAHKLAKVEPHKPVNKQGAAHALEQIRGILNGKGENQ